MNVVGEVALSESELQRFSLSKKRVGFVGESQEDMNANGTP